MLRLVAATAAAMCFLPVIALGQMRITEYMYQGADGEFIEFTNIGAVPINMNGWSFDDNSGAPGSTSLSAFGVVSPGQSVILTESTSAAFATAWGLSGVSIIGGNLQNLGRADEINLYDDGNNQVDRLTYDDQTIAGSIRANNISGWGPLAALGGNNILQWQLSVVGDAQNSYTGVGGSVGNPGRYVIPEPASMLALALLALAGARRGFRD